jgi:lactate racemase
MEHPKATSEKPCPYLHSHCGRIPLALPPGWRLSTLAGFPENTESKDALTLSQASLHQPFGTRALEHLVKPSDRICILIEDLTRTSPKHLLLDAVLDLFAQVGIPKEHITILIALGTHQPLTDFQLHDAFGFATVDRYAFVNHDCNGGDLVTIGQLSSGTPVKINKLAACADFRLGIGSIFPHPLNGFGGGGKILFPGIADARSIFEHHLRYAFRDQSALGVLHGNAFRDEIERLAKAGRLDFIVNSVLDNCDRLYHVVAGDPSAAHLAGTALCRQITSRRFTEQSDVTIISAFPYDQGPQIMKPLAPASMITKPGGTIILHADCRTPLSEEYLVACESFRNSHASGLRQAVFEHFATNTPIMANAPPELNMSMAQTMLAQDDFRIILVTEGMTPRQISRLGFTPADNLEEAIAHVARERHDPTVNVVPAGGVILPIVERQ